MTARRWIDLSWTEFQAPAMARSIAVLPVAAIEQHGPHLPVGVDTLIAEGNVKVAMAAVPAAIDALFLPVQSVGKSNEHLAFPGTITLSWETAVRAWIEIGESVARAGCRKLVIMTSHGGNAAVVDIVARELRVRHAMLAINGAWARLGQPAGVFSAREQSFGIHGGDYETSMMLAYAPETVRMEKAEDFVSRGEAHAQRFARLRVTQPIGFGWMSQDLNPAGVVGEAHLASAEKGRIAAEYVASEFAKLLADVDAFDLADLPQGPLG
jgi:creatinine amidohydrolase